MGNEEVSAFLHLDGGLCNEDLVRIESSGFSIAAREREGRGGEQNAQCKGMEIDVADHEGATFRLK